MSRELTSDLVAVKTPVEGAVFSGTETVVGRLVTTGGVLMSVNRKNNNNVSLHIIDDEIFCSKTMNS